MEIRKIICIFAPKLKMNDMNEKRKELQEKENERHQKYLDLLNSYSDEELDNMTYIDLVENGLSEDCDMGA